LRTVLRVLAEELLQGKVCAITEVAVVAGFSDQSIFRRAVDRGVGTLPETKKRAPRKRLTIVGMSGKLGLRMARHAVATGCEGAGLRRPDSAAKLSADDDCPHQVTGGFRAASAPELSPSSAAPCASSPRTCSPQSPWPMVWRS